MSESAEQRVEHLREYGVPIAASAKLQHGTLKELARKVLKSTVPVFHAQGTEQRNSSGGIGTLPGTESGTDKLFASMQCLQASGVSIAISEDGDMEVVLTGHQAAQPDLTVYSPADMFIYVTLREHERRMLHQFKKRFGGTTEWRPA
jgi:hypothetical protein